MCEGWREGLGDRDVKEKRWPESRKDEQAGGGAEWRWREKPEMNGS